MLRVRRHHQERRGRGEPLLGRQRLAHGGTAGAGGAVGLPGGGPSLPAAPVFQRALNAYFDPPRDTEAASGRAAPACADTGSW